MLHEAQNILSPFSSLWPAVMDLFASASSFFLRRKKHVQVLQVDSKTPVSPWQEHGYRNTGQMAKLEEDENLDYGAYTVQP